MNKLVYDNFKIERGRFDNNLIQFIVHNVFECECYLLRRYIEKSIRMYKYEKLSGS